MSLASGTKISTPDTGSAAAVSVTAFITLLLKTTLTPEWGGRRRSGPAGPAAEPGSTRRAGTKRRQARLARVAARRGGPKGKRRPPQRRSEQRPNAIGPAQPWPDLRSFKRNEPALTGSPSQRASGALTKRRPRNGATQWTAWWRAEQRPRSLRRRCSPAGRRERETAARPARREARARAGQHENAAPLGARSAGQSASFRTSRSLDRLSPC